MENLASMRASLMKPDSPALNVLVCSPSELGQFPPSFGWQRLTAGIP